MATEARYTVEPQATLSKEQEQEAETCRTTFALEGMTCASCAMRIEKLEALVLEGHLRTCVPEGIKGDREEEVIQELVQLYAIAGNP